MIRSMIRQVQHVVMTYANRKLFWLLAVLYILFIWAETTVPLRETPLLWQETQVRWLPEKEFNGVTAFLNWKATDEELRQLRSLTITGGYVVPSRMLGPDGKPTLTLELDSDINPPHLDKLATCVQLTVLRWRSVDMTPALGQTLAKLPNLQRLELSLIGRPIPSMEALPPLPNLRIFQVPLVPPSELRLLARHPLLTTVELVDTPRLPPVPGMLNYDDVWDLPSTLAEAKQIERVIIRGINEHTKAIYERVPHKQISPDAFQKPVPINDTLLSAVAKLPNLKSVEIRDPWGGWPARSIDDPGLRQALASRPDVAINPAVVDFQSLISPFAMYSTGIVLVVIGVQLFSQFGGNWSQTVPAFARSHLVVAAVLLLGHVLIMSVILVTRRPVALLPAVAIAAALPAMPALLGALVSRRPKLLALFIPFACFGAVAMMSVGSILFRTAGVRAVFDGSQPGLTIALILGEVAAVLWAGRSVMSITRDFSEAGIPIGLGFVQTLKQLQTQRLKQTDKKGSRRTWRQVDRRIDSFLTSRSFTNRRQQWRAVEPSGWRSVLSMCLVGPWILCGVFVVTVRLLSGQGVTLESYLFYSVFLGTFSLTFSTFILSISSHGRRPILGQELLRPMLREELESHLRTSIWIDLWPALLATLGYLVTLSFIYSLGPVSWTSQSWATASLGQALMCLTLPLSLWAGMLLLLTISKEFWRAVMLAAGCIFLFGVVQIVVLFRVTPLPSHTGDAPAIVAFASYWLAGVNLVVGTVLAWRANRRLPRVEWGRHA